jgi:hypothetical protein
MTTVNSTQSRTEGRTRRMAVSRTLPLSPQLINRWTGRERTRETLAAGLGWFSIGLGLGELLAPNAMARIIGSKQRPMVLRALGVREIMSGVGILSSKGAARTAWVWSRVAGDALDLTLLGNSFRSRKVNKAKLTAATMAVIGVAALDILCATQRSASNAKQTGHNGTRRGGQ